MTTATAPEVFVPNTQERPELIEMMRLGERGDFAKALAELWTLPHAGYWCAAWNLADPENRSALANAFAKVTMGGSDLGWFCREYPQATGDRYRALKQLGNAPGGEYVRQALGQNFLALSLHNLLGPREDLAAIPLRYPEGYDGAAARDSVHLFWERPEQVPELDHAFGAIRDRYGCFLCEAANGEVWEYMGSQRWPEPVRWLHDFRHRWLREGPAREGRRVYHRILPGPRWEAALAAAEPQT